MIDPAAIAFAAVALTSLGVLVRAAGRNRSTADYYTAGGSISAGRNGLALAGDFISAGGFLGLTGLVVLNGADAALYALGVITAWPLMLMLFAEPLKKLGRYTLADVIVSQVGSSKLRMLTATSQVVILLLGLTGNLVGSMIILQVMFSLPPFLALVTVTGMMLAYVLLGGMIAATWLQIIKATFLVITTFLILALALQRFDFSIAAMLQRAVVLRGHGLVEAGGAYSSTWQTVSLVLGLALGGASMPHVLMRMNTVKDEGAARRSAFVATMIVIAFHIMIILIGFAAVALLGDKPQAQHGGNAVLPLLAQLLGGQLLLGVVSAIALMTMLAVMAGQCIAGSAALTHDIWSTLSRRPRATPAAGRVAAAILLCAAIAMAYAFREQNIGFIAAMSLGIAASANFPTLVLAIFWSRLTAAGAAAGILTGLIVSSSMIFLSPLVQVGVLGRETAIVTTQYPAIFAIPAAFAAAILVSLLTANVRGSAPRATPALNRLSLGMAFCTLAGVCAFAGGTRLARQVVNQDLTAGVSIYVSLLGVAAVAIAMAATAYALVSRKAARAIPPEMG